jgi:NAD-dependent dihydropyrimidine dehydrogenase PreA subunit
MFKPRPKEPSYAFVPNVAHPEVNRYGRPIETVPEGDALCLKSLNINGDPGIAESPNRYKQHGFFFTADHCIACHACEAACSEKNNLPAHIAFRSVGYVEGGSWPSYQRLNISMACDPRLHQVRRIRRGVAGSGHLFRLRLLHLGVPI